MFCIFYFVVQENDNALECILMYFLECTLVFYISTVCSEGKPHSTPWGRRPMRVTEK